MLELTYHNTSQSGENGKENPESTKWFQGLGLAPQT